MSKGMKKHLLAVILLLICVWILAITLSAKSTTAFQDPMLEAEVRQAVKQPHGELDLQRLKIIQSLELNDAGVQSLEGLQYLTGLRELDLRDNQIGDITVLQVLTKLEKLNLRNNKITDISPLAYLFQLQDLNLRDNEIVNIEALRELPMLRQRLYLEGNEIADFSPITAYFQDILEKDISFTEPVFSHTGGFYMKPFRLEIKSMIPATKIYYTLDGSEPTTGSKLYTSPITIKNRESEPNQISNIETTKNGWKKPGRVFKGTVVRAIVVTNGSKSGKVATSTYFVHPKGYARYSMPIISIATNKENLFDYEKGIYVPGKLYRNEKPKAPWENPANYTQSGDAWERPIHIEFYEPDGTLGFSQNAGVRIHGAASTASPIKSLRIYARNEYGKSKIEYPIFPELPYNDFKRIVLRTSGNDHDGAYFRDALMNRLVEGTRVDVAAYRPSVLFINGEYWGIHNIRERFDENYLSEKYGMDKDEVEILEGNAAVVTGEAKHYNTMIAFLRTNDITNKDNYEYIKTQMDTNNFIDYQIAQIYYDNTDWPGNNIKYWRENTEYSPDALYGRDGRWRWFLYDTDFGFGMYGKTNYKNDTLDLAATPNGNDWPNPEWSTFLLRKLLENESFQHQFINRFADQLNSAFSPDTVVQKITDISTPLLTEIQEHIDRWGRPYSYSHWSENVETMKEFAKLRPFFVRMQIKNYFALSGTAKLKIEGLSAVEGKGWVGVNSLQLGGASVGSASTWEGVYFKEVPVTLKAIPKPGYKFAGWQGGLNSKQTHVDITLEGDLAIKPVFMKE